MPWYIILIILLPLLFLIGVIYNSLKAQRRLEHDLLPKIIAEREAERARWQQESRELGRQAQGASDPADAEAASASAPSSAASAAKSSAPSRKASAWDDEDEW